MQSLRLGFNSLIDAFKRVKHESTSINESIRQLERLMKEMVNRNPAMHKQQEARLKLLKTIQQVEFQRSHLNFLV